MQKKKSKVKKKTPKKFFIKREEKTVNKKNAMLAQPTQQTQIQQPFHQNMGNQGFG